MAYRQGGPEAAAAQEYERILALLDERRFEEAQVRGRVLLESTDTDLNVRARTHNLLCWTFIEGIKRASPEAVLHGEEAIRLADRIGDLGLKVQSLFNLASAYHQVGDYHGARETYEQLIELLTDRPTLVTAGLALALTGLSQIELVEGHPAEALARLEKAAEVCQEEENRFLLADIYRREALALVDLHQPDKAAERLVAIPEDAYAGGPRSLWWKTHMGFTVARVELARGHVVSARPQVQNALALAQELGDLPVVAECNCLLALIEQAEGKKDAAKRARIALTHAIHSGRRDVVAEVRERLKAYLLGEF